jgi:alcohol dehydrogenase, propanol-preferring
MLAMCFTAPGRPLRPTERPIPEPAADQLLIRVGACGVCRTDLHVVDGELQHPKPEVVPGHEIVGSVVRVGAAVGRFAVGDRVGVPWLGHTCGVCPYCRTGRENLCDLPGFTGYTLDGGYAEYVVSDHQFCFRITAAYSDEEAASLLCAGLIGYRSLVLAGGAATDAGSPTRLGLYGFGAAAHIVVQVARHLGHEIYAFTRPGDLDAQRFALDLGANWAGDSTERPPVPLDAAIIFAAVGSLVPAALRAVVKGGTVVCAGIHMTDIPSFPYEILWGERVLRSIANLTRRDGEEFLALAPQVPVRTKVETFPLRDANEALRRLRAGEIRGAAVLVPKLER